VLAGVARSRSKPAPAGLGIALWLAVFGSLFFGCAPQERPPNIVMVLVDDLGWSDVGYNGSSFYETPNIDALAREGMVFSRGYAGGANCAPTRASLLSGMDPPRHHIYSPGGKAKGAPRYMRLEVPTRRSEREVVFPPSKTSLAPAVVSLAEMLSAAGYSTARLGKWHLGSDTQGFHWSSGDGASPADSQHLGDPNVGERLTDAALAFISAQGNEPFFLLLSHWDVHTPFAARPEAVARYREKLSAFEGQEWNPTYAAMIENVDRSVGRIREFLRERGLAEDTLFMFASDNGGKVGTTPDAALRGGKGSFLEGGIRVPTLVAWPGTIAAGSVSEVPVTSVDWMPTLAEASGAALPDAAVQPVDGRSLLPLLRGEPAPELEERAIFWFTPLYLRGSADTAQKPVYGTGHLYWRGIPAAVVMKGPYKLTRFFEDGSLELYDVEKDPRETRNLVEAEPERVRELEARLDAWLAETRAPVPTALNPDFDPSDLADAPPLLPPGTGRAQPKP
jgi:arylsulfatase A-like enzyme